jgi:hypothetical protein
MATVPFKFGSVVDDFRRANPRRPGGWQALGNLAIRLGLLTMILVGGYFLLWSGQVNELTGANLGDEQTDDIDEGKPEAVNSKIEPRAAFAPIDMTKRGSALAAVKREEARAREGASAFTPAPEPKVPFAPIDMNKPGSALEAVKREEARVRAASLGPAAEPTKAFAPIDMNKPSSALDAVKAEDARAAQAKKAGSN